MTTDAKQQMDEIQKTLERLAVDQKKSAADLKREIERRLDSIDDAVKLIYEQLSIQILDQT